MFPIAPGSNQSQELVPRSSLLAEHQDGQFTQPRWSPSQVGDDPVLQAIFSDWNRPQAELFMSQATLRLLQDRSRLKIRPLPFQRHKQEPCQSKITGNLISPSFFLKSPGALCQCSILTSSFLSLQFSVNTRAQKTTMRVGDSESPPGSSASEQLSYLSPSFHLLEPYPAICLQLKSRFLPGSRQTFCFTWVTSPKGIPPDRICRPYSVAALTQVLAIMESMSIMSSSIRFSIQASHSNFRDLPLKCNLTRFGMERVP